MTDREVKNVTSEIWRTSDRKPGYEVSNYGRLRCPQGYPVPGTWPKLCREAFGHQPRLRGAE